MDKYPLVRKENIPAYLTVAAVWFIISVISALTLVVLTKELVFWSALIWAAITVMCGMGIMFGASAINLKKLGPGFKRLADGEINPDIPQVWCPVLTAATNAAMELAAKKNNK